MPVQPTVPFREKPDGAGEGGCSPDRSEQAEAIALSVQFERSTHRLVEAARLGRLAARSPEAALPRGDVELIYRLSYRSISLVSSAHSRGLPPASTALAGAVLTATSLGKAGEGDSRASSLVIGGG